MGKELLFSLTKKDFDMQTFRAGGNGGQNQNKRDSGVRFIHRASGAIGEGRDQRSQLQNKESAFKRCCSSKKFKAWIKIETSKYSKYKEDLSKKLDDLMNPLNLKIEYGPTR